MQLQSYMVRCVLQDHGNHLRSYFPTQATLGWGTLVLCGSRIFRLDFSSLCSSGGRRVLAMVVSLLIGD